MSFRPLSADTHLSYADFTSKINKYTVNPEESKEGWQGPPFVQGRSLTEWLARPAISHAHRSVSYAALLLDIAFTDCEKPLSIRDDEILRGAKRCPLMFCILLELQRGDLVHDFVQHGIHDTQLPMSIDDLARRIKDAIPRQGSAADQRSIHDLAFAFHAKQWTYFPLPFSRRMEEFSVEPQRTLPICRQRTINGKGGTAELFMIAVPEEFVDDELKNLVPHSRFEDSKHGVCYQFALKCFNEQSHNIFRTELQAYGLLRDQEHVIKCFGGFNHYRSKDNHKIYSILLEYGECDLAEYFAFLPAPALSEDIGNFWSQLFNVVEAVKDIHTYKTTRGAKSESYDGWHGDIKPDNVLVIERQLKLADYGFVSFVKSSGSQNFAGALRTLNGWTTTYGPPEVNETHCAVHHPWAVDMWSIGCLFSEAATWIVLDHSGQLAYREARQEAIRDVQRIASPSIPGKISLGNGDFFHNGHVVLPIVKQWHRYLRSMTRSNDRITSDILDVVDKYLLISPPENRIRAASLCTELKRIKEKFQQPPSGTSIQPSKFDSLVQDARVQALNTWIDPSKLLEGNLTVEDRKACNLAASVIFSRLSQMPKQQTLPPLTLNTMSTVLKQPMMPIAEGSFIASNRAFTDSHLTQSPARTVRHPNRISLHSEQITTLIAAYYERTSVSKLSSTFRTQKDGLLSTYYHNRDIVFVVDNASSMLPFWNETKFTIQELVGKSLGQDEDGIDLMFTKSAMIVKQAKGNSAIAKCTKAMDSPDVKPRHNVRTNMADVLRKILSTWLTCFRRSYSSTKNKTVIVLTNGQWYGTADNDVEMEIVKFSEEAKTLPHFHDQPPDRAAQPRLSIQFISFGSDEHSLDRLQKLDDDLPHDAGVPDIVDTEPYTGDIYKMLLGSFNTEYDDQKTIPTATERRMTPPSSQRSTSSTTIESSNPSLDSHLSSPGSHRDGGSSNLPFHVRHDSANSQYAPRSEFNDRQTRFPPNRQYYNT